MDLRKRPLVAGMAALLFSGYVSSLGLGDIRLHSALNEPLRADIPLLSLGELSSAEIIAGLASVGEFEKAGVERELILSSIVFSLDLENARGPLLRVSSQKPIREPYLNFLVDVQWPAGRLLREYTLLFDLPVYGSAQVQHQDWEASPAQGAAARAVGGASSRVGPGGEHRVGSGETLWRIAYNIPADLPVRQKMADIQRLNPEAFIDGDMSRIREGAVLRLPDYGGAPPVRQPQSTDTGGGRLTLRSQDVATTAGRAAPSRSEIDGIQEELARTLRENAELKQRLASLEEQVTTMQNLIRLEDEGLRAAQLNAAARPEDLAGDGDGAALWQEERGLSEDIAVTADGSEESLPAADMPWDADQDVAAERAVEPPAATVAEDPQASPSNEMAANSAPPAEAEGNATKQEVGNVGGYLKFLLGLLLVLLGAIVFVVLRKKRGSGADTARLSEPYIAPLAPAQDTPAATGKPQAVTLDEIALREEDDLFAAEPLADVVDEPSDAPPASAEELELDLSEFDLGGLAGDDAQQQVDEPFATEPVADLNLDDEFDFLSDIDEGDTQLELAQAYVEMGDNAGAREILNEVAETGNADQRDKAKALLAAMG
ncbi:MAG: FimV/HubP family polar landmark protein [Porticoccaceae bacterium]